MTSDQLAKEMKALPFEDMEFTKRHGHQNQILAVQNIFDALIELITNCDDRYVVLRAQGKEVSGNIEIEVERRRKGTPSVIKVRDYADGMTLDVMRRKLKLVGDRVSGMEEGYAVRGTNSRGAKDVAALGRVSFESIAEDGNFHKCEIDDQMVFYPYSSVVASSSVRNELGIPEGTGTVVTVTVDPRFKDRRHDTFLRDLRSIVPLRDIFLARDRRVTLKDINSGKLEVVEARLPEGKVRLKERFSIPGYPDAEAKLVVYRAKKKLDDRRDPLRRQSGILIKSKHAIHQATYFARELEDDPNSYWFYGRLTCDYIDDLWNDYDDKFESREKRTSENPYPIIDPLRKRGLNSEHPFTKKLFQEALKRFRPLVDDERKREEAQRADIETHQTRRRLNALEKAAAKYMSDMTSDPDSTRTPDAPTRDSRLLSKGFSLSPAYAKIVVGHSQKYWLNIRQQSFPELAVGDVVQISCATNEIVANASAAELEKHPSDENMIRAVWSVAAVAPTKATAICAKVGAIDVECHLEVIETERELYDHISEFGFGKKNYTVTVGKRRNIQIYAPYPEVVDSETEFVIKLSNAAFEITGSPILRPRPELGVAMCKLSVRAGQLERSASIEARLGNTVSRAYITSQDQAGAPLEISLVTEDFKNDRSKWKGNVLEIAAKHPSVRRYLGSNFKDGQDEKHFHVLLAEIVAEAVCSRILRKKSLYEEPELYEDADWEHYFSDYSRLMTGFLPIAHKILVSG